MRYLKLGNEGGTFKGVLGLTGGRVVRDNQ